ncbi:hypothetical protein Pmar_PMAR004481, partial [Perkinsus marinus ATCC 50983]
MVYWKPNALQELYVMAEYAFSTTRCRRGYLAAHMGDAECPSCDGYCDICNTESSAPPRKSLKHGPSEDKIVREVFYQLDEAAARGEKLTLLKLSEKCRKNLHCEIEGVAVATISLLKSSHLRETFDATAYSVNSYIEKRRTSSPRSIWEFTHREIESSVSRVFNSRAPQVELNVNEEKLRIVERKLNHGRLEIAATVDKDMPPQKI